MVRILQRAMLLHFVIRSTLNIDLICTCTLQRKALLHLRKLYVGNLAGMVARREKIVTALQVHNHASTMQILKLATIVWAHQMRVIDMEDAI